MFARPPDPDAPDGVPVTIDGVPFHARAGDSVAAALLAAGTIAFRTSAIGGAPRGPYCLMGTCFECLVEIDGVPNRQACTTRVAPGMRIAAQRGAARVDTDA
ncbi:MAG: (2Fe-2S)-binding protein [Casimicrobiaceae bacterium]